MARTRRSSFPPAESPAPSPSRGLGRPLGARERALGMALVVTSAAAFGAMAIFARAAYDDGADPIAVLALRFAIAGAVMAAVMVVRRRRWPRGRDLAVLAALGGLGYVGQSFSYFTALQHASASVVAMLLYLFPAIVTILSVLFLGDRLDRVRGLALAASLAGTALVVGPGGGAKPLGIALGVVAAVTYAVYIVVSAGVTARVGAIPATTVILLSAAVVDVTIAAVLRPSLPQSGGGYLAVAAIAIVSTVVAATTFFAGMRHLGPADSSTLSTVEPVVTVALASVLLDERLGAPQVAGGVLILSAVVVLARHRTDAEPA